MLNTEYFAPLFFQVIQKNQNLTSKTADPPSAAILAIYLDQAHDLPVRLSLQNFLMWGNLIRFSCYVIFNDVDEKRK